MTAGLRRAPTLLIIDDDPLQVDLIAAALERLGWPVVTSARSAREALALLQQAGPPFAAVICDLQMPDTDGIGLLRELAQLGYGQPIILCSGEDPEILRVAAAFAQRSGLRVAGTLVKPVTADRLAACLAALDQSGDQRPPLPQVTAGELRQALDQNQLLLHFQPKVATRSGVVKGVESLVRWQHPERGMIPPAAFVPLAERAGLIDALTERVLALALETLSRWRQRGLRLELSVNLSMDNLHDDSLPDRFKAAVHRARLSPSDLILELTESRLMGDTTAILGILAQLRLAGFGLSIDDFGTGFSSLAQLQHLPFTELKIDRAFVHDARADPKRLAILRHNLELAASLGLTSVAEGVEDEADLATVTELGADFIQGYHVCRPLPAGELERWLAARA